jgi:exopolysaccharide biosynthesis polyprenyl glycosylphosphotransferase
MATERTRLSLLLLRLGDLLTLAAGLAFCLTADFVSAEAASHSAPTLSGFLASRVSVGNALLGGLLLLGWQAAFAAQGLYRPARLRWADEMSAVARAAPLAAVALFAVARVGGWLSVGLWTAFCFGLVSLSFVTGGRVAWRVVAGRLRRGGRLKSLLIVGGGRRGQRLAEQVVERPELGYRLLGYVESDPAFSFYELAERPWLGRLEDLPRLVADTVVDEVVVALPVKSRYAEIERVVACLEEQGVTAHLLSDLFPAHLARAQAAEFEGTPLVSLLGAPGGDWRAEVKRLIDVTLALAALVVLLPLFAVVALAIKLDSRGPVFFVQRRMGYHKREFRLFKFRTMTPDAEVRMKEVEHLNEKDGPVFKIKDDPRVTRVGRWLRRTSVDELPQLVNVALGEMSLVGPRPLSLRDARGLSEAWQKRRFSVKPGITGLWQVSGRSDLSFERWMRLDLEYIDRWSVALDLRILCRTIPAVLTARGAA